MSGVKAKFSFSLTPFRYLLRFGLAFLLFDALVFRWLFWQLPDESTWTELPFYHFEHSLRRAANEPPESGRPRVVFAGSSLAMYSVLPDVVRESYGGTAAEVDIRLLSHQGLSTMHLLAYADRILATRPDVVVLPLGTVDFRLERPIMQDLAQLDAGDPAVRANALRESLRYTLARPELSQLAPAGWLRAYGDELNREQWATGGVALLSGAYRYRRLAVRGLRRLSDNRFSRGRSYHEYAGVPIGGGGISRQGWTADSFELSLTAALLRDGLLFQVPDELMVDYLARGTAEPLSLRVRRISTIGSASANAVVDFRVPVERTGWQTLRLSDRGFAVGDRLRFTVSHTRYDPARADQRGVRLTRNAGRDQIPRRAIGRELRREDTLYRSYSDREYAASFRARILNFERAGTEYLEALQIARRTWAGRAFDPELPGFVAFQRFRQRLARAGVPLVVVNNPENPLTLQWYGDSNWYADYLRFLSVADDHTAGRNDQSAPAANYYFFDTARLVAMQMFYDYHHLSYFGAEQYSQWIGERLRDVLVNPKDPELRVN